MNTESQNELIPTQPGDVLRHKRLQKGASLEQVAAGSRIRLEHIEAIEAGSTSHIPQVYLNGYIRSYARYLGLPAGAIEKHLPHAKGSSPEVQTVFTCAAPRSPDDRWFKATSYVLASAVVIALVWQFTAEAVRFSQGDPVARSDETGAGIAGSEGTEIDAVSNNGALPTRATSHLQASIAPMEDVARARPEISRSGAEGAWTAISQVTKSDSQTESQAKSDIHPLREGEQAFRINASADSWVEIVDANDEKIEMDLLRAGNGRDYVALAPVRLLLGRASSIELTHNGEAVDLAPYTRGNVARITLGEPVESEDQPEPVSEAILEPAADKALEATPPQDEQQS